MNDVIPMADSNHSPGPWTVDKRIAAPGKAAAIVAGDFVVADTTTLPNFEANARLIAAAPDLLEALKAVVAISDRKHDAWDAAHAAIAKAEGK
jgi:hypothetical protein